MSIIALFSGEYCAAEEIVQRVATRLGYTPVGDELLVEAARRSGLSRQSVARALSGERGLLNTFTHEWEKSLIHVRAALAETLKTDQQIVHGPAALLIPARITHSLWVEVTADQDFRIAQAKAQHGLDADAAAERLRENDEDVSQWLQALIAARQWEPTRYDLRIPLPTTTIEAAVEAICEAVSSDAVKPTDRSIQAVLDFQLATSVNLALLERGHHYCEVEADAGRVKVVVTRKSGQGKLARTLHSLRYDNLEREVREIAAVMDGVQSVEVRPGAGFDRPARTLLVDDERDYVMTLSERLQMREIASNVVHDGEAALTFVKTEVPDVMVLDLRMPGLDGLEVLRRTKREHPQVEVIVVTGHGSVEDEKAARELGAFDYLSKPVDIGVLSERIRAASKKAQSGGQD